MKTRLRNKMSLAAWLIAGVQGLEARTFQTSLPEVRTAGFYRVLLPPHMSAIAGPGLGSLRLRGRRGGDQPYLTSVFPAAASRRSVPHAATVPVTAFSQTDSSDKRSYLRIRFDEAYVTDELRLRFSGPRYYSRVVRLQEGLPDWQARVEQRRDAVIGAGLRMKEVTVVVENEDNPPLRLRAVAAWQKARYLTAWLEPGSYVLRYSDSATAPPRYDITVLADSLDRLSLPLLRTGSPELVAQRRPALRQDVSPEPEADSAASRKALLWGIICAVLVALVYATRALVRRIGSEPDGA